MGFGSGGSSPPAVLPPPPLPPSAQAPQGLAAADTIARRAKASAGQASLNPTGPQGLGDMPMTTTKSLLGQ